AARSPAVTRGHVRPRPPRPLRRRAGRALAPATLYPDGLLLLTRRLSGRAEGLACRAPAAHPVLRRRGHQPAATVHRAWRPGKRRPSGTAGPRGPRTRAGLQPPARDMAVVGVTEHLLHLLHHRVELFAEGQREAVGEHLHRVAQALAEDAELVQV